MVSIGGQDLWMWRRSRLEDLAHLEEVDLNELVGELDWLLREVTGLDRLALRLGLFQSRPDIRSTRSLTELDRLWTLRIRDRVPIQYLVGHTNWRNFVLKVAAGVLIPRPETEQMIDLVANAVQQIPNLGAGPWVDLGTGSGAIALGLAEILPEATIYSVDVSPVALAIARENIQSHRLDDRIQVLEGSWFEPLVLPLGSVRGICSNPPYIPTDMLKTLQPEVVRHEPHIALDGGANGLQAIDHLIDHAQAYLCPQGLLLMECMAGQGEAIAARMENRAYQHVQIHRDGAGLDRFVQGTK